MHGKNTLPIGQMIRYPEKSTDSRYIFSIWPFPEQDYLHSLSDYFTFCRDYYRKPVIVWTCRMWVTTSRRVPVRCSPIRLIRYL
jgi:hypothetical protein